MRVSVTRTPFIKTRHGFVSVEDVFSLRSTANLCDSVPMNIVILKFLMALTYAALCEKMAETIPSEGEIITAVSHYITANDQLFYLDDPDIPFLQYPQVQKTKKCFPLMRAFHAYSSANRPITQDWMRLRQLTNAEKIQALLLLVTMPFSGNAVDKTYCVETQCDAKRKPNFYASALGAQGLLHTFIEGKTLLSTIRLNLIPLNALDPIQYPRGFGSAPWEALPTETNQTAITLSHSLMGQLVPMHRFVFIEKDDVFVVQGLRPRQIKFDDAVSADLPDFSTSVSVLHQSDNTKKITYLQTGLTSPGNGYCHPMFETLSAALGIIVNEATQGSTFYQLPAAIGACYPVIKTDPSFAGFRIAGLRLNSEKGQTFIGPNADYFSIFIRHEEYHSLELYRERLLHVKAIYDAAVRQYLSKSRGHPSDAVHMLERTLFMHETEFTLLIKHCLEADFRSELLLKELDHFLNTILGL